MLIALLRKRLLEFDTSGTEARLILSRDQILDLIRVFASPELDDVRLGRQMDAHINRIVDLGFLHRLRGTTDQFEVRRIIRSFVDAQWLATLDQRLDEYLADLGGAGEAGGDDDA